MATGLENLKIYQLAEELEIETHKLLKCFPLEEKYRTVDQLSRSSSSVANNIAESYNKQSTKDKIHILHDLAKTEAEETKRNLIRCVKRGLCGLEKAGMLADRYTELIKGISGYIRFLRKQLFIKESHKLKRSVTYRARSARNLQT